MLARKLLTFELRSSATKANKLDNNLHITQKTSRLSLHVRSKRSILHVAHGTENYVERRIIICMHSGFQASQLSWYQF